MFDHTNDVYALLAANELDGWMDLAIALGHDPELFSECVTPEDATLVMAEDLLRN